MSTISVIVPVYRVEPYLRRCVDSLLCQSMEDFELVLVDDGSPDRCGEICEEYAQKDSRVQVLHRENGGLSAARNTGIDWAMEHSDSRWLCFADSDDWVHPRFLELLLQAAQETGCALSACGVMKTSGQPLPDEQEVQIERLSADDFYCQKNGTVLSEVAWNKLYRKDLFETLRYPYGKIHEDEFTTYRIVYAVGQVAVVSAQLYAYYQNPQGITGSKWKPARMDVMEAFRHQIAFAGEQDLPRLQRKTVERMIYGAYDQLPQAHPQYRKKLRTELRYALKLGRELGVFSLKQKLWAYEAAYPCKPLWWLVSRINKEKDHE